jgi:glycosyltransferase involved in cell wall biosynthesis
LKYIVAFNGARDRYQVPLALAERNKLETLVTDLYLPDWAYGRSFLPLKIQARYARGISSANVKSCPDLFLLQNALKRFIEPASLFERIDVELGRRVADQLVANSDAGLILYSGYALEAFEKAGRSRLKFLFFFHPHNDFARTILARDALNYPQFVDFEANDLDFASKKQETRRNKELELADYVLCASQFTQRSVIAAGVPTERTVVVPYGGIPTDVPVAPRREKRFLFVGQGVQRKGLHHLLQAWDNVKLRDARLDIVCYRFDKRIARPKSPNIYFHGPLPNHQLRELFQAASVFVMPSLVEGFGLVYLEALAAGCMCIGTKNTGLPDLEIGDAAIIIDAGALEALETALVAADSAFSRGIDHKRIADRARLNSWASFRQKLVLAVGDIERRELISRNVR